jgi:hypothetical protein
MIKEAKLIFNFRNNSERMWKNKSKERKSEKDHHSTEDVVLARYLW